jgi:hypothetical protein
VLIRTYGASDLKPTRRKAALGGDDDECLLVDHRARTLENLISRPLNKMRSVRLRCELLPVTQSRDVIKESRPRIEKVWSRMATRYSGSPLLRALRPLDPTCWFEIACTICIRRISNVRHCPRVPHHPSGQTHQWCTLPFRSDVSDE